MGLPDIDYSVSVVGLDFRGIGCSMSVVGLDCRDIGYSMSVVGLDCRGIGYSLSVVGLDCREHVPSSVTDGFPAAPRCDLITFVRPSWDTCCRQSVPYPLLLNWPSSS